MKVNLTKTGIDHLAQCLVDPERKTKFVKIEYGNGENAGRDTTALSNSVKAVNIVGYQKVGEYVELTALLNSSSLNFEDKTITNCFKNTELGVFIEDPDDENKTILFGYGYEDEYNATSIPVTTNHAFELTDKILVYIGENENITAIINDNDIAAVEGAMNDHIKRKDNPHEVTKTQVGLGLVPNVTTNDQTPTFAESEKEEELKSGEKLSTLFGKLAKIVKSVIVHIADINNPHKTTPYSIGAAEKEHKHNASTDITTGILGVLRGGTGVSSYGQLITKIGPVMGTYKGKANRLINGGNQFINLGFTPSAVIVSCATGWMSHMTGEGTRGGMALKGQNLITEKLYSDYVLQSNQDAAYKRCMKEWDSKYVAIQIEEKGFRVNTTGIAGYCELNNENETYYYIAFRQGE